MSAFQCFENHALGAGRRKVLPYFFNNLSFDCISQMDVHFALLAPKDVRVEYARLAAYIAIQIHFKRPGTSIE